MRLVIFGAFGCTVISGGTTILVNSPHAPLLSLLTICTAIAGADDTCLLVVISEMAHIAHWTSVPIDPSRTLYCSIASIATIYWTSCRATVLIFRAWHAVKSRITSIFEGGLGHIISFSQSQSIGHDVRRQIFPSKS